VEVSVDDICAEKSRVLLSIKEELHKKMNLLNQLDYLKVRRSLNRTTRLSSFTHYFPKDME